MKKIITIILFIVMLMIGIVLVIMGNINTLEKRDLYYEDIHSISDFKNNIEYHLDSSHIEIIGRYFHTKSFSSKNHKQTRYYYNVKVTNSKNQHYYMIMELNEGARINMEKGELRNLSGTIRNVSDVIKNNQISSLEKKGITDNKNIYSIYLDVPSNEAMKIVGISFIITSIISSVMYVISIIRKVRK